MKLANQSLLDKSDGGLFENQSFTNEKDSPMKKVIAAIAMMSLVAAPAFAQTAPEAAPAPAPAPVAAPAVGAGASAGLSVAAMVSIGVALAAVAAVASDNSTTTVQHAAR